MVCCWHHLSTVTGTVRLSVDSFNAMDSKLHLSCSQWAIIKMCSNSSIALRSNSPIMEKTEIFPTEESIQSTVSAMAQKWKLWCLKFRGEQNNSKKMSLPCIAWSHLVSGPRSRCCKFLPLQALHIWLLQSDFSSWPFLTIFPACLAGTTQELPIPRQWQNWLSMSNTSLGFAFSQSSVMAAQGASLVEQEGLYVTCP